MKSAASKSTSIHFRRAFWSRKIPRAEFDANWSGYGAIFDRTVDSHLSHIRRKLRSAGLADVTITSVYGVGYRLDRA